MSLVVVAAALVFRTKAVPLELVLSHTPGIINLLAGSLAGAWLGAGWATRMRHQTLYEVIAVLLLLIAVALMSEPLLVGHGEPLLVGPVQWVAGMLAGFRIGVVASLMGVAGGDC